MSGAERTVARCLPSQKKFEGQRATAIAFAFVSSSAFYRMTLRRTRAGFVALALGTIVVGLVVHWRGTMLPARQRDLIGDALWAMMIYWSIGALGPSARLDTRAVLAVVICWGVEFSQLYHAPTLDAWRGTTAGQLVLGSGFDLRDLGAYALGVLAAWLLELNVRRDKSAGFGVK